jgi:hypothetical protein
MSKMSPISSIFSQSFLFNFLPALSSLLDDIYYLTELYCCGSVHKCLLFLKFKAVRSTWSYVQCVLRIKAAVALSWPLTPPLVEIKSVQITLSRDGTVGIVTGYRLNDRGVGVWVPVGSRIFSAPHHPDWFWGPPSLPSNGYEGLFPQG